MQFIHVNGLDESNAELSFKRPKGFPKLSPIAAVVGIVISATASATGIGAPAGIGKLLACKDGRKLTNRNLTAANIALQAAAKAADKESFAGAERTEEDIVAHAILAEAALQATLELDESVVASQAILERANEYIPEFIKVPNRRLPIKVYDIIRPTILATILDYKKAAITLPKIGQHNQPLPTTFPTKSEKFEEFNSEAFVTYLAAASRDNVSSAEFGFKLPKPFGKPFRDLEGAARRALEEEAKRAAAQAIAAGVAAIPRFAEFGFKLPKPPVWVRDLGKDLEDAARRALSEEAKKAAAQAIAAGAAAILGTGVPEVSVPGKDSLDGSIERAVLAEAVLAAVTGADADVLQAEGFFDTLFKVATDLAPKILPPVIGRTSGASIFDIINKSLLGHDSVGNGFVVVPGTETGQSDSQSDLATELWSVFKASSAVAQ